MTLHSDDVPHQWLLDRLTALCMMDDIDKQTAERIHQLFVQRFPDDIAAMKQRLEYLDDKLYEHRLDSPVQG